MNNSMIFIGEGQRLPMRFMADPVINRLSVDITLATSSTETHEASCDDDLILSGDRNDGGGSDI